MQVLRLPILFSALLLAGCASPAARSAGGLHFDYGDLARFGIALDTSARGSDSVAAFAAYVDGGGRGLRAWHSRYTLRPARYTQLYAQAPRFFRYLAGLHDSLLGREPQISAGLESLHRYSTSALARDLPLPPVSYFVTPLGGGGGAEKDVLMIGVDYYGRNPDAPLDEFRRGFFPEGQTPMQSLDGLVVAAAHELAHFYQRHAQGLLGYTRMYRSRKHDTLLARAAREGCAEFLAELSVGFLTPDQAAYATPRELALWEVFRARIEQQSDSNPGWFSGRNPHFPDAPWQVGYWVGARMCGAFYRSHPDPRTALREILAGDDTATHWRMVAAYDAALGVTPERRTVPEIGLGK